MLKKGDLYKNKYKVLLANDFFFVIDNQPPYDMTEFNIIKQGTNLVVWRYETLEEAGEAFDLLTSAMEQEIEQILLKK
jgi:hypothetical protein